MNFARKNLSDTFLATLPLPFSFEEKLKKIAYMIPNSDILGIRTTVIIAICLQISACKPKDAGGYSKNMNYQKEHPMVTECPSRAIINNVTLPTGIVSDVRIISDGETIFYIPFSWYVFSARNTGPGSINERTTLYHQRAWARYKPSISFSECPGLIHKGVLNFQTPRVDHVQRNAPPNFSLKSKIDQIGYFPIDESSGFYRDGIVEYIDVGWMSKAYIRINDKYAAQFKYPVLNYDNRRYYDNNFSKNLRKEILSGSEWISYRRTTVDLFTWLATPPKDRDNDRIFSFGGE